MKPVLIVVAGPNGAGKTTVTTRIRADHWSDGVTYINPDEIAEQRFNGWNDPESIKKAAQWAEQERHRLLTAGESLAFETVLSMSDKLSFVQSARANGYFVRGFFVSTTDPTINAARVTRRVMEGGHTVPIEKIVSRYARSMANLERFIESCDRTYVYDNSVDEQEARLIARYNDGALRKAYGAVPDWVVRLTPNIPQHADFEAS
ncbi:MAG TPA: zeta toxin family protein [Polyangiaceae bacterium]|nr:zeta toxin family protein [Polyangiaceae bacterium]